MHTHTHTHVQAAKEATLTKKALSMGLEEPAESRESKAESAFARNLLVHEG